MNSRILLEDGMDPNQRLPVSRTSTSCMVISGNDYRNQLSSECSRSLRWAQYPSRRSVFPSLAESASDTEEDTGATDTSVGTCQAHNDGAGSHLRDPVVTKAPVKTSVGVARRDTEKFGSLKAVLGKIPALCANRTVRSQSPA